MNSECGPGTSTTDVVLSPSTSSRKRSCSDSVTNEGKKRSVSYSTYVKWRREFDRVPNYFLARLRCNWKREEDGRSIDVRCA